MAVQHYYYPQLFELKPLPPSKAYVESDYEYFSPVGMIERITVQGPGENRKIQIYFRDVISGNAWLKKHQIAEITNYNDQAKCHNLYCALTPLVIPRDEKSLLLLNELVNYTYFTRAMMRD